MEALGGDELFFDRFLAQHVAFFYYWIVVSLYMFSPATAYNLNQNVEEHAFATYSEYLSTHAEELRALPAPKIAVEYYEKGDLSLFDAFQNFIPENEDQGNGTGAPKDVLLPSTSLRRPVIKTLYDVIENIKIDESEHVLSMKSLQLDAILRSKKQ